MAKLAINNNPSLIFSKIALTLADPKDGDALRTSCHFRTTQAISSGLQTGKLKEDDEVVLVGTARGEVYHSVIARGDELVFDSAKLKDTFARADDGRAVYETSSPNIKMEIVEKKPISELGSVSV